MTDPHTPLRTIRRFCLECVGGSADEVRACTSTDCPLHPYRFGSHPDHIDHRPIRAVRNKCLWCQGGSTQAVEECPTGYCPLHRFRHGKNPKRKLTTKQCNSLVKTRAVSLIAGAVSRGVTAQDCENEKIGTAGRKTEIDD